MEFEKIDGELDRFSKIREDIDPGHEARKIILIYLLIGSIWIGLSDKALAFLFGDLEFITTVSTWKGWFYVAITGWIFYRIIKRSLCLYQDSVDIIFENYKGLSYTHKELIRTEIELQMKYRELDESINAVNVSEQRYNLAVQGANDGIWEWDVANDVYRFSEKWLSYCGYGPDDLDPTINGLRSMIHPDDRNKAMEILETYIADKKGEYQNIFKIRCKDGSYKTVLSKGVGVWDDKGNPIRMAGSHTDITKQVELQNSLKKERELSENIIEESANIIILLSPKGEILRVNEFASKISGYSEDDLLGRSALELVSDERQSDIIELYYRLLEGEALNSMEEKLVTKEGEYLDILWSFSVLHDDEQNVRGIILSGTDITERKQMEAMLYKQAYYDDLTKLPNRALLASKVKELVKRDVGDGSGFALIYIDIDNFKHINDIHGHFAGDEMLKHMAKILIAMVGTKGFVARLSGDEFIVVLEKIRSREEAVKLLEAVNQSIKKPWIYMEHDFYINVSSGIVIYPDDGTDLDTLLKRSDLAMFEAKASGKNKYLFFTERMELNSKRFVQMESMIRKAIENKEFQLYYQPEVDLKTGKIVKLEALIRWEHKLRGFISPGEFIPVAEQTGHIDAIGDWVLNEVCEQVNEWLGKGLDAPKISVNLSSVRLSRTGVSSKTMDILTDHCVSSGKLEFEITETAVLTNEENVLNSLLDFKSRGITIALDDFGTGFSSLTHLQSLPIDVLKIDRSFLMNVLNNPKEESLYLGVVSLAQSLGLSVVAEGIETKEQAEFLLKNNCDLGQGYYFSKAIPAEDIELLLKKGVLEFDR
ncbi:bifunctional diguanylate cyclase/phosphodiesterase [Alkalibacter mobilis]|uniref:bifunctional diguanylate cyclase/phosphodiesterase n=1 Tax=Alkalibacter mobilis TaxID=2787712 RepID=UPI00189E95BE|nr:GGDEF domain-containing phosphodiesterase [Alkalibacter mobilis]MBF7096362.1 EAL domain-containing protein [Alkalibacter mobilis]